MLYQQGDVLFYRIEKTPTGGRAKTDGVIAEGEATGHHHAVVNTDGVELVEVDGTLYLKAGAEATVKHEEHKPVVLPKGNYRIGIVREYDHFAEEAREVRD